jgi:hypothetical protein
MRMRINTTRVLPLHAHAYMRMRKQFGSSNYRNWETNHGSRSTTIANYDWYSAFCIPLHGSIITWIWTLRIIPRGWCCVHKAGKYYIHRLHVLDRVDMVTHLLENANGTCTCRRTCTCTCTCHMHMHMHMHMSHSIRFLIQIGISRLHNALA